jgi:hypothetical protein
MYPMDTVCDRIFARDWRIGFAMVMDSEGKILESKMRGKLLMPRSDIAAFAAAWTSVIEGILEQMQRYFGKGDVLTVSYEKVNVHGFKANDKTVVITARRDLPIEIVNSLKNIEALPTLA